jgi:hypothetical protein
MVVSHAEGIQLQPVRVSSIAYPQASFVLSLSVNKNFHMNTDKKDSIVMYTDKQGKVELRADVEKDTLWATQAQIAEIFKSTKQNIGLHLKNIFLTRELKENSVVKDFFTTASDGKRYSAKFYNLDCIIAVGYRINSKKATQFRIWATGILRDHLIKGFSVDKKKLSNSPERLVGFHEAVAFLESKQNAGKLKGRMSVTLSKKFEPIDE